MADRPSLRRMTNPKHVNLTPYNPIDDKVRIREKERFSCPLDTARLAAFCHGGEGLNLVDDARGNAFGSRRVILLNQIGDTIEITQRSF